MMKLNETIDMMNSEDYKERFKAEYMQLKIRLEGLDKMLDNYKAGTLTFNTKCSIELLNSQLRAMIQYKMALEERANIEGIELDK